MKEYNDEIIDNNDPVIEKGNSFDDIEAFAKYGIKDQEILERHAKVNAGFHDYESDIFVSKKKLNDLCIQYRVFFEGDPKFSSFIEQMTAYSVLDPYKHEDYVKEQDFVRKLPKQMEELIEELDKEEAELNEKAISQADYDKLTEEQKQMLDREFILQQEILDNRRRALASFDIYFGQMVNGTMKDLEEVAPEIKQQISVTNNLKGHNQFQFKDEKGRDCYYINATGVKMDLKFRRANASFTKKIDFLIDEMSLKEVDMRDAPLFPHEPRYTDVSQGYSASCYFYSVIADICRLYPQKIRDMIKDNGDGTATVRLFGYKRKGHDYTCEPVYVRVDKTIPQFGGLDRLGEDCLWLNLIEKAYVMSGLHLTYEKEINEPISPERVAEGWVPKINDIEGGFTNLAVIRLLGEEGKYELLKMPQIEEIGPEASKYYSGSYKSESLSKVNKNDPMSIVKHAIFVRYKENGGTLTAEQVHNMTDEQFVEAMRGSINISTNPVATQQINNSFKDVVDFMKLIVKDIIDDPKNNALPLPQLQLKIGEFYSRRIEEARAKQSAGELTLDQVTAMQYAYNNIAGNLIDGIRPTHLVNNMTVIESTFNRVADAVNKGQIVTAEGRRGKNVTEYVPGNHAYTIIGTFKTKDTPPKLFFRIKNPQGKDAGRNGVEYFDSGDGVKVKRTDVEDGIFDIQIEHFMRDYEKVYLCGNDALLSEPHKKVEGYDIIDEDEINEYENERVTSDLLTDYMKVSNELYDALLSTNSKYSNDSNEYKELVEGMKIFRHKMAMSNGMEIEEVKKLADPLLKLVEAYETHVSTVKGSPSKRQKRRKSVCENITTVVNTIKSGLNPEVEAEKAYAIKLIDFKAPIDNQNNLDVANKLYNNKAFRNVAANTSIVQLLKPKNNQMKEHIEKIEKSLKGRGIDKDVNVATMNQQKKPNLNNLNI